MLKYWIRKNLILNVITLFSFLIFIFFISHIFFGERSLSKVFELNKDISIANKEYNLLLDKKNNITSEINLLRDNNLDADIVSEISHKLLGFDLF
jgi:Septum formation initiator